MTSPLGNESPLSTTSSAAKPTIPTSSGSQSATHQEDNKFTALAEVPGSPGAKWLAHSRNSARKRLETDELSWSRHSVASTSSGLRASAKYDEIELGLRRPPAPLPASIYFGGCAFGASFYIGCIRALCDMYGPQFYKDCLICGDSGGSIFAVGLSLGFHPEGRVMCDDCMLTDL